jgi:FkbM family methyltransferase
VESEEPVHEHLAELFERTGTECVLDVGANAGQYGAMLRDHAYGGWIVSLEPVAGAFQELSERARPDERWRTFRLALGSQPERRRIAVASVSQLSSFRNFSAYASKELPGASDVVGSEEVEVRTLNQAWPELLDGLPQDRTFLKLDTQGWDLEVLRGAEEICDRLVGVQVEAALRHVYEQAPTFTQTMDRITALGFDLTGVFPVNRDSLCRLIEVDCVFINPSRAKREDTWAILSAQLRAEVARVVPAGSDFVLIDDGRLGLETLDGRRAIPFLERNGQYHGAPDDGEQALVELAVQTGRGIRHVVVAWPSFWWLEEYPELSEHLASWWRRTADTDAAIVFEHS